MKENTDPIAPIFNGDLWKSVSGEYQGQLDYI